MDMRRLSLAHAAGVVSLAREFAREALRDWAWLPGSTPERRAAVEDALLVISELVTNACLHAGGPEELRLGLGDKLLRVEVSDREHAGPAPRTTRLPGRPGGHGMFIVQRLSTDWGVVPETDAAGRPRGKMVWAELPAPSGD